MPKGGKAFFKWLQESSPNHLLSEVRWTLFGLGDSSFGRTVQWVPNLTFKKMADRGAKLFFERGYGDESTGGYMTELKPWTEKMLESLNNYPLKEVSDTTKPKSPPPVSFSSPQVVSILPSPSESHGIQIAPNVYWVGALDFNIRNFHGIYVPRGSTYNSYLILGECPTLIDTVKAPFKEVLLDNIRFLIDPKEIKLVVIHHSEPDHTSSLGYIMRHCPNAEVVCTSQVQSTLMKNYVATSFSSSHINLSSAVNMNTSREDSASWKYKLIKSSETLKLSENKTLLFLEVPMVHWPDSTWSYLIEDGVLFSNDAFGQHMSTIERFDDSLVSDPFETGVNSSQDFFRALSSYYANVLMPFGKPIMRALELLKEKIPSINSKFGKSESLPTLIAPAHGICIRKSLQKVMELYERWSTHRSLPKVLILYATMYGTTERIARAILQGVVEYQGENGQKVEAVIMNAEDVNMTEVANEILESACVAIGSSSLNNEVLPWLSTSLTFIKGLKAEGKGGVAFNSYGWSPIVGESLRRAMIEMGIEEVCELLRSQFNATDSTLLNAKTVGQRLAVEAVRRSVIGKK
eukprot:TRINITY_DN10363_c0_g1_i4.p1 TRINITY_DN10363_c0_g1~~TRINITY_DN10363_c0_g1_i4.p1  ORF type:complete len:577 (-),score=116.42 TRINITY_DN10363_c0_g1_i4:67-1797(-)